jgi:hypothetical protein
MLLAAWPGRLRQTLTDNFALIERGWGPRPYTTLMCLYYAGGLAAPNPSTCTFTRLQPHVLDPGGVDGALLTCPPVCSRGCLGSIGPRPGRPQASSSPFPAPCSLRVTFVHGPPHKVPPRGVALAAQNHPAAACSRQVTTHTLVAWPSARVTVTASVFYLHVLPPQSGASFVGLSNSTDVLLHARGAKQRLERVGVAALAPSPVSHSTAPDLSSSAALQHPRSSPRFVLTASLCAVAVACAMVAAVVSWALGFMLFMVRHFLLTTLPELVAAVAAEATVPTLLPFLTCSCCCYFAHGCDAREPMCNMQCREAVSTAACAGRGF